MSKEVQAKLDKWFSDYGKEHGHNPTWGEVMEMKDRLLWEETFKKGEEQNKPRQYSMNPLDDILAEDWDEEDYMFDIDPNML